MKFPTKRSAVAVFEMARARKADRERTAKVLQDLYRDKKKSGIPGPEKEANDTFVYVVQKVGIPRPDWYQDERMALMGLKPESPGGAVGREWNSLRQGRRKVVGERMIRGQRMYVVRSEGVPRETFFPVEDLENVIAVDESELRSRAEAEKRDATRAKEEAKARAEKRNLRGFEKRFSGVQLERVIDTLNRKQGVRGVFLPRREHMENLVREGYVVRTHPKYGRVLEGPDGGFFFEKDLTKTALDYADYLSNVGFGSTSPERRAIPAEPEEVDSFLMEAFGFGGDS